jgi:hypothetical protein
MLDFWSDATMMWMAVMVVVMIVTTMMVTMPYSHI